MLRESIRGMDLSGISNIVVTALKEHVVRYGVKLDRIAEQFKDTNREFSWNIIDHSQSQVDTIRQSLLSECISFVAKDCDNYFNTRITYSGDVNISVYDLNKCSKIKTFNKTYIDRESNVSDSEILSSLFCCGAYYFSSSLDFMSHSEKTTKLSEVIRNYIANDCRVQHTLVENYVDWGTLEDWETYKNQYQTLLCDIDGVLVESSGQYLTPCWGETSGITENIKLLKKLYYEGKTEIILTTCRNEQNLKITEEQLNRLSIPYHQLILLKYGGKRIVINDYAKTNKYPTCEAINIPRNASNLKELL